MLHLSRILLPCLLVTLLLAACGVPDAPSISESSPSPAAISPSRIAEAETTTVLATPLSTETPSTPRTPSALAETAALPADSSSPSPAASAESTPVAAGSPQPINLSPDPIAAADFSMQSTIALTATEEGIVLLDWSPDGTQLLFKRLSKLWLYTVTSGEKRLLLDNVRTATWSPDGQRIAYVPRWNQALGMEDRRVLVLDLATKHSVEIGDTQARGPITSRLVLSHAHRS